MAWMTAASIGASVGGSLISGALGGSKSAERAAKDANAASNRLQENALREAKANLSPYMNTGTAANQRLAQALGIADPEGYAPRPTRQQFEDQYLQMHYKQFGKGYNRNSDMSAVNKWVDENYNKALSDWEQGAAQYEAANPGSTGDGYLLKNFTNEDFVKDPGYQFRMDEGNKGINRASAARGGYDSGATLKALTKYNQDYASNEFGNAYNRDAANKSRDYGFLSGTSNSGQQAAGALVGAGQSAANAMSNSNMATAQQVGAYQMQNAANLNNSIQSGIGNSLYALRTAQKPTTTYDGSYDYGSSQPKPWWMS